MPCLKNPQHERVAREMAHGRPRQEIGVEIGFSPKRASRSVSDICGRPDVKARIAELVKQISAKAVNSSIVTKQWVIEKLIFIMEQSMEEKQYSVARSCAKDIGEELGMFVQKSETKLSWDGDISKLTDQQLETVQRYFERVAWGDDQARINEERQKVLAAGEVIDVVPEPQETEAKANESEVVDEDW